MGLQEHREAQGHARTVAIVECLRAALESADALLISSPEYAPGVRGSWKNALDWPVSDPAMVGKLTGFLAVSALLEAPTLAAEIRSALVALADANPH